jgi:geranylgeranyl diphosphate synthase, type I
VSDGSVNSIAASVRVDGIVTRYRDAVLRGMGAALDRPGIEHIGLIRYHLGWQDASGARADGRSGKMLRPALSLLCCEAAGGDLSRAVPAAAAIELLHNFTLIHDDIEDASETRHGRATLWKVTGIAQAINAGDGLFAIAQRTLLSVDERDGVSPDVVLAASRRLNDACIELCEGQYLDLSFETRATVTVAEYEAMVRGKSAVLVSAACAIGAIVAGASGGEVDMFSRYGLALGLGFQVQDDVLGIWGLPEHTGKPVGDDIRTRKKSYPIVYAMEQLNEDGRAELLRIFGGDEVPETSVQRVMVLLDQCGARQAATAAARGHVDDALAALRGIDLEAERRADLEAIAAFAVERSS